MTARAGSTRYGWTIVASSAVVMLSTLPGRTQGLGLITEPLLQDLGLDRVAYATINLWATLIGAAFCLPAGWAIDRIGLRLSTFLLLAATAASAFALSLQHGAFLPLLIVVVLTRGFGQSALSVASITAVGKWFPRRPGLPMGVYAFLTGLLFAVAFGVVGWAVRTLGWRAAWTGVAASIGLALAPLALLFIREAPRSEVDPAAGPATGLSLPSAIGTPAFWIFGGATAMFGLVSSGLGLFQQAVLEERGFDQHTYHTLLVVTTLLALVAQLLSGWLSLHASIGTLTAIAMVAYAAALALLSQLTTSTSLWIVAGLMGISGGVITVVFFAVWGQAFGTAHLGRIQAAAQMLTVLASAIGPLLFAQVHAWAGSYSPALLVLAPLVLLVGLAAWRVRLPHDLPGLERVPAGAPAP